MAPWGARQGWSGVGEGVEAAAPLRNPRPAPLADDPPDEAPPPRRPIALSPSLPNLVFGADADAHVPPAPWGDAARDGAAAGTMRAPAKRARAAPVSVAARVLALVDAHERLPPSPFARWRERLREEAENRAPRSGPGHASSRAAGPSGAGGGGARGTADAQRADQTRKIAPPVAPPPSLTWDQHAVFLQFPPTRRATADDLPRGLAPATLTELYRRVEREQRRFFAYASSRTHFDAALESGAATRPFRDDPNDDPNGLARYRRVAGDEKHVVAEARWRARLAEAAFETDSRVSGTLTRGVAPKRVTAMPSVVALERVWAKTAGRHRETPVWANSLELGADLDLDPAPDGGDADAAPARAPAPAELETVSLRRGDALAPPGADAGDAVAARAIDAVSSLSPFCFVGKSDTRGVGGVALDGAMTAAAFACLASHAPDRRGRAWEVPFRVDAVPETGGTVVRLFDPLPSRDLSPLGARARAAAYWDCALRARLEKERATAPRLIARSFRVAPFADEPRPERGSTTFAVVAAPALSSAVAVADYAAAAADDGERKNAAEEAEAFRWEDAARAWVASALAPRRADGDKKRRLTDDREFFATVARVAVADGTVVDVHAVDRARAVRMGAEPPPEPPTEPPTEALLADGRTAEETPRGGGASAAAAAAAAEDAAEDASAGGATAEPWFHRGFDPDLAAATVHRVLRSIREACAVPGRYVLAHRAGEAFAELYRDADADAEKSAAATGREPAPALPRRRGRPPTAPRANSGVSGSVFLPGPGASTGAAKRRRRRGASARGDGAFAVANVAADDEDVSEEEDEETLFSSGPSAGRPERPVSVPPARKTVVLPAPRPRARRGPEPGTTYDLHASFVERVAGTSAATRAANGELTFFPDADDHLGEVVPRASAQRPPPGQIPFTFAPRGEPPQPGARRARKMWTSLLAPAHATGDASHAPLAASPESAGDDNAALARGSPGPVPGARYCHKFAHFGTCRAARCPFPHVSLAEARAGAVSLGGAEARARRAAYGNLVAGAESQTTRRRNWAGA